MTEEKIILVTDVDPYISHENPKSAAWRVDEDAIIQRLKMKAEDFASLGSWVIFAPWAHPYWDYYCMFLVHLRPIEGKPATISFPGATHEMTLFALDPDHVPTINDRPHLLHPANFAAQFMVGSDEDAKKVIEETIKDVVAGRLNPDTDFIQHWIKRFGASNIKGDPSKAGETKLILTDKDSGKSVEVVIPPQPSPKEEEGGNA